MPDINIDQLSMDLHENAIEKGFWEPFDRSSDEDKIIFYLKQLAMIHSEVSEVLEAIRKEKGDDKVVEELADILIRVFDLYAGLVKNGYTKESLQEHLIAKAEKNTKRPKLHGVLA